MMNAPAARGPALLFVSILGGLSRKRRQLSFALRDLYTGLFPREPAGICIGACFITLERLDWLGG